jgi:exonuclease 3'-5' domain-containing protein 1
MSAGRKDYIQEAKDYFSHKLIQYGAGTEVPIKSLLGHRSQASPQVRHISGQHIKEFTDFLAKHPDTFRVTEDHVVLVNFDSTTVVSAEDKLHLPLPSIDIKNTQQILDFFAQCIDVKGPILVDQLFHLVTSNFAQENWYRIFKTPNDLTTFLKLFSDCFHIQSNLVTLLQKPKINENHIHHAQKILYKNTVNQIPSPQQQPQPIVGDFKLNEPISNTMMIMGGNNNINNNNNNNNNNNHHQGKSFKSNSPSLNYNDDSMSNGRNSTNDLPSLGLPQTFHEIKLENLCSKNCPPKLTYGNSIISNNSNNSNSNHININNNNVNYQNTQQNNVHHDLPPTQQVNSPIGNKSERTDRGAGDRRANLTLKQRISNLVTKTLAENEEKDKKVTNVLQPIHNSNGLNNTVSSSSSTSQSSAQSRNYFMGDTWKIKVLQNTRVITTIKESQFVCEAIRKSAPPDECVIISFDCEGVNLGVKGQLTIIEIGTIRGEAFIFDLQLCPQLVSDGGLKGILEDENIIKIIHDCRNDSFNLYAQYNVLLRNVFDTQVIIY